jgi:hypothetical protein
MSHFYGETDMRHRLLPIVVLGGLPGLTFAWPIEVIYTKIPGHPTASIPGTRDLAGNPAPSDFRAMENLYGSPDGSRWLLKGRTQLGSDLETMLLVGSGTTGTILIQEGQPALGGGWYDFIGSDVGRFNDFNDAAFSVRCRTVQTGSNSPPDGHRVLRWHASSNTLTLEFKQGDPYTGLVDAAPNPSGDELVGNSVGSIHLLNGGTIGCQDSTIQNIHSSRRPAIFYELAAFHQSNVTTVAALGGLGSRTWNTIDANEFFTTPDGQHWVAEGRINTDAGTARVLVYDGSAVLQENLPVAGSSMLLGDIFQTVLASNGSWISRGRDNSGTGTSAPDWVVLNGTLIARTGDPITPGSTELWGDTFIAVTVDRRGNHVIIGSTNNPDPAADSVAVLNGSTVIVREGDRVDLNGNGQEDDDAFIGRGVNSGTAFSPNNLFLAEDGYLYFIANLRDSAGNDLNSNPAFGAPTAFLRVRTSPGPSCDPDVNCDGSADGFDVEVMEQMVAGDPSNFCQADADFNRDGSVDGFDVEAVEQVVGGASCP